MALYPNTCTDSVSYWTDQLPLLHDTRDTTEDHGDEYDASSDEQVEVKVLMEMDQCSKRKLVVPHHFSLAHGPS